MHVQKLPTLCALLLEINARKKPMDIRILRERGGEDRGARRTVLVTM